MPKIAFLLDFDGPLFNTELVEGAIQSHFNVSVQQWTAAYNLARIGNTFVDIGVVLSQLAPLIGVNDEVIWQYLEGELIKDKYCPASHKEAFKKLLHMGHVELITQGNTRLQDMKLEKSGVKKIIEDANAKHLEGKMPYSHSMKICNTDKITHLRPRLTGLLEDGYIAIQIDDRIDPLDALSRFAEEQQIGRDVFQQFRIRVGKYKSINNIPGHKWKDLPTLTDTIHIIRERFSYNSPEGSSLRSARINR